MDYKTLSWLGIHIVIVLLTGASQIMNEPTCDRIFHLPDKIKAIPPHYMENMSFHQALMNLVGWLVMRPPILQSITIKLFFCMAMIKSKMGKASQVIRICCSSLMRPKTINTPYFHDLHHTSKEYVGY